MLKNTIAGYGQVAKLFHWLMAALFVGMYIVAYIMINISRSDFSLSLYALHKATGLLLLTLVLLRLLWRLSNIQPDMTHVPKWQHWAARGNIFGLYILMLVMPITGILTSTLGGHDISFYGIFTISALGNNKDASTFFGQAHELFSYLLIACFVLHVLAALYHHYFLKDNIFKRILFSTQSQSSD